MFSIIGYMFYDITRGGVAAISCKNSVNEPNTKSTKSTFLIMKTYGTASYKHVIWDLKMIRDPFVSNHTSTFNCISTITMKNSSANDVSNNIHLTDDSAVRLV